MGPEGGNAGGHVIATGTPESVAQVPESHTGRYLKAIFDRRKPKIAMVAEERVPLAAGKK
jgi:excinuclease ABC subunit A